MIPTTRRKAGMKARVAAEVRAGTRCPCEEHDVRPPTDFTVISCAHKVCQVPLQPRGRFLHWGQCEQCKAVYWDSGLDVIEVDRAVGDNLRRFL